jgi:hypothetical protein
MEDGAMDIHEITQAARVVTDEKGAPVVMLPLALWQELLNQIEGQPPQHERLKAILNEWKSEPSTLPDEWWDKFDADLKANRTNFAARDLGLNDS